MLYLLQKKYLEKIQKVDVLFIYLFFYTLVKVTNTIKYSLTPSRTVFWRKHHFCKSTSHITFFIIETVFESKVSVQKHVTVVSSDQFLRVKIQKMATLKFELAYY